MHGTDTITRLEKEREKEHARGNTMNGASPTADTGVNTTSDTTTSGCVTEESSDTRLYDARMEDRRGDNDSDDEPDRKKIRSREPSEESSSASSSSKDGGLDSDGDDDDKEEEDEDDEESINHASDSDLENIEHVALSENSGSANTNNHHHNSFNSHTNHSDDSEINIDGMNDADLLALLTRVANAQGIPLQLLLSQVHAHDDSDDDDVAGGVVYPFETKPTSLKEVADFIQSDRCRKILILAGAGMSVASGIPDYRSQNGFYATLQHDRITCTPDERRAIREDPSCALEQTLFLENPLPCLELKRDFILGTWQKRWKATLAHRFVELLHSKTKKLARLYTQNIDGLEDQCTQLPTQKRLAVHGSMDRAECAVCGSSMDFDVFCRKVQLQIKDVSGRDPAAPEQSVPIVCPNCGKPTVKPAIVLFRSSLPRLFFDCIQEDVQGVDLLLILGTSLRVAPANSLVYRVPRSCLRVLLNLEAAGSTSE